MLAATSKNWLRVWNISRREAKLMHNRKITDLFPSIEQIHSIKCNATGNKISIAMLTKVSSEYIYTHICISKYYVSLIGRVP